MPNPDISPGTRVRLMKDIGDLLKKGMQGEVITPNHHPVGGAQSYLRVVFDNVASPYSQDVGFWVTPGELEVIQDSSSGDIKVTVSRPEPIQPPGTVTITVSEKFARQLVEGDVSARRALIDATIDALWRISNEV